MEAWRSQQPGKMRGRPRNLASSCSSIQGGTPQGSHHAGRGPWVPSERDVEPHGCGGLHVLEMLQQRFRRSLSSASVFALETPLSREYGLFPAEAAS